MLVCVDGLNFAVIERYFWESVIKLCRLLIASRPYKAANDELICLILSDQVDLDRCITMLLSSWNLIVLIV